MRLPVLAAFAATLLALAAPARAEDTKPPDIRHTPPASAKKGETVLISAQILDQSEIFSPTVYFRYAGARSYSTITMAKKADAFVATVQATGDVEYYIEAYDEYGNGPTLSGSASKPYRIALAEKVAGAPRPRSPPKAAPVGAPEPPPAEDKAAFDAAAAAADLPPPPVVDNGPVLAADAIPEEPTPVYQRWWFIGGAAVVVGVVAAVTVVALQPDPVYRNVFSADFKRP